MAEYASLEFSNSLDSYNKTPEQREVYEIESDIYGGFYAHIAGYDALSVADVFLDSIYQSYSLPYMKDMHQRLFVHGNKKLLLKKYDQVKG